MIDFSGYSSTDLIPHKTIALVQINLAFGDASDNVLTYTKDRSGEMLKFEALVLEGEYAKRKIFGNWLVLGSTEGQKQMAERYLGVLKGILASARYLDPSDLSPDTLAKYKAEWRDFHNLRALVEIGIEKGKDGYEDKNVVVRAITRDMPAWDNRPPIEQPNGGGGSTGGGTPPAPPTTPIPMLSWAD